MATVTHFPEKKRFIAQEAGVDTGYLEYETIAQGRILAATHVVTRPEFRGRGIAGEVTAAAFEYARRNALTIRPVCPYVAQWVRKNPQVSDLVDGQAL